MHASVHGLPLLLEAGSAQVCGTGWDGLRVGLVSVPASTDFGPLLAGLPGDLCSGDHWGYLVKGRLRVTYPDGSQETLTTGDFFHLPAGHTSVAEEATDFVEITNPAVHDQFLLNARHNLATAWYNLTTARRHERHPWPASREPVVANCQFRQLPPPARL